MPRLRQYLRMTNARRKTVSFDRTPTLAIFVIWGRQCSWASDCASRKPPDWTPATEWNLAVPPERLK